VWHRVPSDQLLLTLVVCGSSWGGAVTGPVTANARAIRSGP
jgi:hypothetical protein